MSIDRTATPPLMSLAPGSAIVTGGGSGNGKAIALALADAGAPVAAVDLLPEGGILEGYAGAAGEAAIKAVTPGGRRGTVEEIVATARFLASDEAGYITGHTLVIEGGWTAR